MQLSRDAGLALVGGVTIAGILQSLYLLVAKPFAHSKRGAWDTDAAELTNTTIGSPSLLLFTRTASFLVALGVLLDQLFFGTGVISLKFYTVWSFCLLILYFGIAASLSFRRWRRPNDAAADGGRRIDGIEYSAIALFHVMLTTVCIVDSVTWLLLWPMIKQTATGVELERLTKLMLCTTSYIQHGGNAILALIEVVLNRLPVHPYLCGWVGLWSVLYLCWALLWRYASGFWLYPFLDFTKTPQAYPGLFVAHNLFFLSVLGLDWMKKTWLARRHMKQRPPQLKTA